MTRQMLRFAKRLASNSSGSAAPMFALALLPVVMTLGLALDCQRAFSVKSSLQHATDSASIAVARAALATNGTLTTRLSQMGAGYVGSEMANVRAATNLSEGVGIDNGRVKVSATAFVPTTFGAVFINSIRVDAVSTASVAGSSQPLCVLGLNAAADDTVKIWGSANLQAPNCAVQSNSSSAIGLDSGGSGVASAGFFCAAASSYGGAGFSPRPAVNCPPITDPYQNKYTPTALSAAGVNVYGICDQSKNYKVSTTATFNAPGPNTPYIFCGGLTVNAGASVTFGPGVYVIYGQMLVSSNATVNASSGVTFYFGDGGHGTGVKDGYLTIQGGGNITLKAPTSGPLAGMAIVQPLISTYMGGTIPAITNTITGSGALNITGVIYTPEAQLLITGNGELNTGTSYFAMVADFVTLQGNGTLNIGANSDAASSGMPAMQPVANPNAPPMITN